MDKTSFLCIIAYEPVREKTNNLGFQPGLTQTRLYSHRSRLEACNFGFRKKKDCTIFVAKTKALISCAVTAQLICGFVFAYANCWFSHAQAHTASILLIQVPSIHCILFVGLLIRIQINGLLLNKPVINRQFCIMVFSFKLRSTQSVEIHVQL